VLLEEVRRRGAPASVPWAGSKLLTAYVEAGKKAEAAKLAAALVREARAKHPAGSAALAEALADVGKGFLTAKAHGDAEPLLHESYDLAKLKAPDAWATHHCRAMLGAALLGQKKYPDAERHLVDGYQGMKKAAQDASRKRQARSDQRNLTEALEWSVQLYDAWQKPQEAERWRKDLEAHRKAAEKVGVPGSK
jgi:eukaryotic-like serine/threonine-protein kinase